MGKGLGRPECGKGLESVETAAHELATGFPRPEWWVKLIVCVDSGEKYIFLM
jgi:hypothetical protein